MLIKAKLKAFLIHLTLSAFVIGLLLFLIFTVWYDYPAPYFQVSGLEQFFLILVGVDLTLGPLLTFVVYKPLKNTLVFDLSVIAIFQIMALSYGVYSAYQVHPVYIVYSENSLVLMSAQKIAQDQEKYDKFFKVSTFGKPTLVNAKMPTDMNKVRELAFGNAFDGDDLQFHPEYYEPLKAINQKLFVKQITIEQIKAKPKTTEILSKFLIDHKVKEQQLAFIPLIGNKKNMLWAFDRETHQPIGLIDIDPYQHLGMY